MESEKGNMRATAEHDGNRNNVGQQRLDQAKDNTIQQALTKIANVRKKTVSLQRGVQVNIELNGHRAAFYRVIDNEDAQETALVLLNKGNSLESFDISEFMQSGKWVEQLTGQTLTVASSASLKTTVKPNGVQVWVRQGEVDNRDLFEQIKYQLARQ